MSLVQLLKDVRACRICEEYLPLEPKPILHAGEKARLLIVGQAPGIRVHETVIPWNDPSGDRLRGWLQIDKEQFYNENKIAIIPMGFCYPGKGKSGDLPPRPECAEHWQKKLISQLPNISLTLLIGQYAQGYYLGKKRKDTLTKTVKAWKEYYPEFIVLPHPSPRNNIWLKKNQWFEKEVIPALRKEVKKLF